MECEEKVVCVCMERKWEGEARERGDANGYRGERQRKGQGRGCCKRCLVPVRMRQAPTTGHWLFEELTLKIVHECVVCVTEKLLAFFSLSRLC